MAEKTDLSPDAVRFMKRHGDLLKRGGFLTFGYKAKKSMATVAELAIHGLVNVRMLHDGIRVTSDR